MVRVVVLLVLVAVPAQASAATPIMDPLPTTLPRYQGAPAAARPLPATGAPRNSHLAPGPRSNIHNDTWMTDAYRRADPSARTRGRPRARCGRPCAAR